MANTTYVVPQLRVFQQFAATAPGSLASMTSCMIGPHYKVFDPQTDEALAGQYAGGAVSFLYPGLSGGMTVQAGDYASFKAIIRDAEIERGSFDVVSTANSITDTDALVTTGSNFVATGTILTGGATALPAGFYGYKVGDKVAIGTARHTIVGFIAGETVNDQAAIGSVSSTLSDVEDVAVAVAGTMPAGSNTYRIVAQGSFTQGDTASFNAYNSRNQLVAEIAAATDGAVAFPALGITLTFGESSSWAVGDTITVGTIAGGTAAYTAAVLDGAVTVGDATTVEFLSVEDVEIPHTADGDAVFTATGVTLAAGITKDGGDVLGGSVYLDYRALDNTWSTAIQSVNTTVDADAALGPATLRNPLAMMVRKALLNANGQPVMFLSIGADTAEAYSAAFNLLDSSHDAYSIVPFSDDEAVHLALRDKITELAGATRMNWKIGWLSTTPATEVTALATTLAGTDLKVTISGAATTSLVLTGAAVNEVSVGDRVELTADGATISRTVTAVSPLTSTVVVSEAVAIGTYDVAVIHPYTEAEKAALVADYASSMDDRRIRLVVGDDIRLSEYPDTQTSNAYLAAALAGLRSASAPHQPLTRVTVAGFVRPTGTFTASAMDSMAAGGTWIVTGDLSGNVFTRHQLTTCTSDYKLREDSKTTNADEISRYYREQLSDYYGRANISPEFIQLLYLRLSTIHQNIRARNWDVLIGPQILEVLETTIETDPDLSDRLIIRDSLSTPDPLNNLDVYLTVF